MTLATFNGNVVTDQGIVVPSATVTIRNDAGAIIPQSQIWTKFDKTATIGSNPYTTDALGTIHIFTNPQQRINITAEQGGTAYTILDDLVMNAEVGSIAYLGTGTGAADVPTNADLGTAAVTDSADYATAAQGTLADSALQAADLTNKADLVGGVIPNSQLPSLAITDYLGSAANQTALLLLNGQRGDWATRTDLGTTFILTNDGGSSIGDWTEIATPADAVSSVNGNTGAIVLDASDVGAATSAQGALADSATQPADLGTAAAADLTTSATDATADRVLKTNSVAMGYSAYAQTTSIENIDFPAPMIRLGNGSDPGNLPFSIGVGDVLQSFRFGTTARVQMIYRRSTNNSTNPARIVINSTSNGTTWRSDELWTTGNYQPETSLGLGVVRLMKNNSGATIVNGATVAGSDLVALFINSLGAIAAGGFTIPGTWVNVRGNVSPSDTYCEFVRIA